MVEQMPKASEQHSTTDKPIVGRMQREITHRTQVKELQQTIYEQTQRKKLSKNFDLDLAASPSRKYGQIKFRSRKNKMTQISISQNTLLIFTEQKSE